MLVSTLLVALPATTSAESTSNAEIESSGPALLPFEATRSRHADVSVRATGERHRHDKTDRGRIGLDINLGIGEHFVVGAAHSVVIDQDADEETIGGFDDLRLRGILHGETSSHLRFLLIAELAVSTRASNLEPVDRRQSIALTIARDFGCASLWLRPGASAEVEGVDELTAGAELGGALSGRKLLVSARGAALQVYRDSGPDRLAGYGAVLVAWRPPRFFVGLDVEAGFRPEGYGQITLALGLRSKVW